MGYQDVIREHYIDLNNLTTLLKSYIEMYRLLISSTAELNNISVAKKSEMKHALDRINEVGDLIDNLLKVISKCEGAYIKYCFFKNEVINSNIEKDSIETELHDELVYHNKNSSDE